MDNVYAELDDAKAEVEKLKAEIRLKTQLFEGLKEDRAQDFLKFQETRQRTEEQARQLDLKSEEISGLRALVLATEKKCSEAEEKAQQAMVLKRRDDVILQLEEENISVKQKIKWRNEQFKHLEEAHEKLQAEFRLSKEEWDKERSVFLEEVSSLQISLDSQTRNVEGLQSRLEMCNHALAHEESKRKLLETEISEFKASFENVYSQCEEKKSEIHELTILRNDEIARLRNSLGDKEMVVRELKRKIVQLEQDNKEFGDSLKELREAQINNCGANSLTSKLRNKLRRLEEAHKSCASMLKSKESQWGDQAAKMEADIATYKSALINKEQEIRKLQIELDNCFYVIEEDQMGLLIFKSELAEAHSKPFSADPDKAFGIKENENMVRICTEQLRVKDNSLKTMARRHSQLEEELEQQKKKLEESSEAQLILKEQLLQMEYTLHYERSAVSEALERLELEIASKSDVISRLECEVQNWKSTAEALEVSYEEIQGTSKKMETSVLSHIENEQALKQANENLLCIVKDQERKTEDLLLQITSLEMCNAEKMKEAERYKQEKEGLIQIVEQKDCCIKDLQKNIAIVCLKQESMEKELKYAIHAQLDAEKALKQEKEILLKIKDEKDRTIKHFQELATVSEQDLLDALCFSFSKQVEKWVEVSVLSDALRYAEYLAKLEIEEKNTRIVKSEESLFHLKQEAKQLQASLEVMKFENEKLTDKQQTMEYIVSELKFENGNLLQEIMNLSTKREDMLSHFEGILGRIGELSSEDIPLMEMLGNMLNTSEDEIEIAMGSVVCEKPHDSARDNGLFPPNMKKTEENFDGRSPLREVNGLHM